MSYQSAPPPPKCNPEVANTHNCNCCPCCFFTCNCKPCEGGGRKRTENLLSFLFGVWLIVCGIISLILTALDPVFALTYRFPKSPIDTISHNWDCLSFGGMGVAFGVLIFFCGLIFVKYGSRFSDSWFNNNTVGFIIFVGFFIIFLSSIAFVAAGLPLYARRNRVADPDLSHDIAITSEGYELPYQICCGEYMRLHHPVGLVGTYFGFWAAWGIVVLCIILYILRYVFKFIFHLFVCESVCPELNTSLEKELTNC